MEKKASFQFKNFIVKKSLIELNDSVDSSASSELQINIEPFGMLNESSLTFELVLKLEIKDDNGEVNIHITSVGSFKYDNMDRDNLDSFLYVNAPAIMFPYIRAYISTLTSLSGIEPIILPTLNLSRLKNKLVDRITYIQ